jgi:hypothetical protein
LRIASVLDALPDEALVRSLEASRKKKRDDYPLRALWRSAVAGILCGHGKISELLRELARNAELREICGFYEVQGQSLVPPEWVYSRFFKKLAERQNLIEEMFDNLLRDVAALLPDFGKHLAVDSKALPVRGKRADGADTGTKQYEGGDGLSKFMTWFGYKLHLLVDAVYELPVAFEVTAASVGDSPRLMPMVRGLREKQPELYERVEELSGDKGYDDGADKAELYDDHGITPLIPPRNLLAKSENPIRPLDPKRHDAIYTGPTGEVYCKIAPMESDPEKAFARMQFMGFEKDRGTLKFRCPAAAFGIECRNRDTCQCAPLVRDGSFGRVVRVPLDTDRRVFLPQHFHSQGFEQGYKRRTAVERVNSRLDNVHGFENTALRTRDHIALRVGLVLLVMLASAKSWVQAGKTENIRRILRPAA